MNTNQENKAILLIHCRDKKGIVASVTQFLAENQGNILYLDQHVDQEEDVFFMRLEWDLDGFRYPTDLFGKAFASIAGKYDMQWKLYESGIRPRMAIMVSKLPHCLDDIPARYMQILSSDFVSRYRNRIINIHHSFLPAFPGAKPYHLAYTRGVKIIGGTSHYVTEDLEKIVLSRAIHAHLNRKVMVYKNKTIVFS